LYSAACNEGREGHTEGKGGTYEREGEGDTEGRGEGDGTYEREGEGGRDIRKGGEGGRYGREGREGGTYGREGGEGGTWEDREREEEKAQHTLCTLNFLIE
jgi:hypothetical protein